LTSSVNHIEEKIQSSKFREVLNDLFDDDPIEDKPESTCNPMYFFSGGCHGCSNQYDDITICAGCYCFDVDNKNCPNLNPLYIAQNKWENKLKNRIRKKSVHTNNA
jgi:hypothetical protein